MYDKVLIIGYGSIGRRHASILKRMSRCCHIVSQHEKGQFCFDKASDALKLNKYDLIVISNETHLHRPTLQQVREYTNCKILVEKPLYQNVLATDHQYENIFVGYNLRFHPLINQIKEYIKSKKVYSVEINACKYLPAWRPNSDYRKSYSADPKRGGGVLLDLSHELDYLTFLFGELSCEVCKLTKCSGLQIDTEDKVFAFLKSNLCANILLNLGYVNRIGKREVTINLEDDTLHVDLLSNKLHSSRNGLLERINATDESYILMHKAIMQEPHSEILCGFEEAFNLNKLIRHMKDISYE